MNDLNMARKWAKASKATYMGEYERAAAEVIQSLPDQWVDAEKVQDIADNIGDALPAFPKEFQGKLRTWQKRLSAMPTPSLPTLAELIEAGNKPKQYKWMQADLNVLGDTYRVVILNFVNEWADCMRADGARATQRLQDITPLPDLPKLEWPGDGVVDAEIVEDEPTLPRPEDVPPGEPWIVMNEGHRNQWVGTRGDSGTTNWPWTLVKIDGTDYALSQDVDVTLVSRLVPELTA